MGPGRIVARIVKAPQDPVNRPPTNIEWAEAEGLRWDYSTPAQVRQHLMDTEGMSPVDAFDYVEQLRGTQAGSLMLWDRD